MNYADFETHYQQYKHKIFSYLYYRSGKRRELAEDLTQEVFLKALQKFHTYRPDSSFQSWIYAIAHNHLVDYLRKNEKTPVELEAVENILESDLDTRSVLLRRVASEEVGELLTSLSDEEKEILLLRYTQELPMKDIADIIEKPDATVRVIAHRALAKLRKRYAATYA